MTSVITKYLPATNSKPARVKADAGMGRTATVSFHDAAPEPHRNAAHQLCAKFGWTGTLQEGGREDGFVYTFISTEAQFDV